MNQNWQKDWIIITCALQRKIINSHKSANNGGKFMLEKKTTRLNLDIEEELQKNFLYCLYYRKSKTDHLTHFRKIFICCSKPNHFKAYAMCTYINIVDQIEVPSCSANLCGKDIYIYI